MGVDGRIFPVGTKPADTGSMFADDWFPIQVKQTDRVGRPDIDQFCTVMEREGEGGRQRGSSWRSDIHAMRSRSARRFIEGRVDSSSC